MATRYAVFPILGRGDHHEIGFNTQLHSTDNRDEAIAEATKHNTNHTYGVIVLDYLTGTAWSPDNRMELENAGHPR